jgi:hypothetical protein
MDLLGGPEPPRPQVPRLIGIWPGYRARRNVRPGENVTPLGGNQASDQIGSIQHFMCPPSKNCHTIGW